MLLPMNSYWFKSISNVMEMLKFTHTIKSRLICMIYENICSNWVGFAWICIWICSDLASGFVWLFGAHHFPFYLAELGQISTYAGLSSKLFKTSFTNWYTEYPKWTNHREKLQKSRDFLCSDKKYLCLCIIQGYKPCIYPARLLGP